ncbi:unnamed protein product [Urochloa decumbens]|uniref:DUF6598 domain-containing protein n=1 Tax=Urochloa decumbens TaxID=240449 RepID=A0ABC9H383_9POAL
MQLHNHKLYPHQIGSFLRVGEFMATAGGVIAEPGALDSYFGWLEDGEEECSGLEPFFYDEEAARAEHAAAQAAKEKLRKKEAREKERRDLRRKAHMAVKNQIRDYDKKQGGIYYSRFCFADFSKFDINKESSIGPMRYTNRVCKPGERPYELCEAINILFVDIVCSDVGFPINVYGTVIARDAIDLKCVYLFRRNRDDCELINSKEESLTLTGPKRGLALIDDAYVEFDLKIKGDGKHNDKELSKGFVIIDGIARRWLSGPVVESRSLATRLSTVEVVYGVVKDAVEATIAIEVVHGDFYGAITACTTSILDNIVLHDGIYTDTRIVTGAMQLLRSVVAVYLKESLFVTIIAQTDCGEHEKEIEFTPNMNGDDAKEVTVCGTTMLVKVVWSIIDL